MRVSHFFIDRPIFATVLSIVIVVAGAIAYFALPVARYPEVVPPTVVVTAYYPGATPDVIADTVATPIEQEVNGVEHMLYMSSQSTSDGQMQLTITFKLGTDLNEAQVLVQNRVAVAEPRLPEDVRRIGVTTEKSSPDFLLVVHLLSPDDRYDQAYISNYALIRVRDVLARIDGVGDVTIFGAREYSMRVWLDPDKIAARNLTASDVVQTLRQQNVQVAGGVVGQPPVPQGNAYQLSVNTLGRLTDVEQFGDIVVRTGDDRRITRLRDVARVEVGARDYSSNSYLDGKPAQGIGIFQRPGSNALATAQAVRQTMDDLSQQFPEELEYRLVYDPTVFVQESMNAVFETLLEAFILVFIVVLIFLQDWRATLLPMIDVPVSLIGTLGVMAALGFSLNNLSLFGLVLAIGIVVDDAIVVVENIERWMAKGLEPREATLRAMAEITGPVIAITLVLSSVFIPTAFLSGISGQFYRQFALTIAASTIISAINALTMAPARAVQLIKPPGAEHNAKDREALPRPGIALITGFLAYRSLTPALAPLLGLSGLEPGAHEGVGQASSAMAIWGLRGAIFLLGGVVGWVLSPLVNRLLAGFFRGFNWFFDRMINAYGRTVVAVALVPLLFGLLSGCVVGPDYKMPPTQMPGAFANEAQAGLSTDEVETAWWHGFQDERLNQLVELALANNHDLRVATARIREARALLSETEFDRYPTVTSQASYTRARLSEAVAATPDRDIELYDAGFDATWELDFFGRVRRSIEASSAEVGAEEANLRDAVVSLLAEVARNYFELRGTQNRLAVARQNAENQRQTLDLTIALLQGGRGTELDTSRAEAQWQSTLASIPPLETAIKRAMYRLGVLIGQQPTALEAELSDFLALPTLPALVALGRPEDLLRRRPDIRATERNLAAATARVGVETADLFPRVILAGSVALQAGSFLDFGKGGSDTFAIGPSIFWAAFDLGRVRARIRAADARSEAALAQYEQRVLLALEETETSLVDLTRQQARRDLLWASAQAGEKAQNLARERYQFGVADFLTVLDAERTLLAAQDQLADSETRTATALVAVYKALGGGWEIVPERAYSKAP